MVLLKYRVTKWDDSPSPTLRSLGPTPRSVDSSSHKSQLLSPTYSEVESPVKKYIISKSKSTGSLLSGKGNQSLSKNRSDVMSKNRSDASIEENMKKMIKVNKSGKKKVLDGHT